MSVNEQLANVVKGVQVILCYGPIKSIDTSIENEIALWYNEPLNREAQEILTELGWTVNGFESYFVFKG